jgi:hypothetical protein
MALPIYSLGLVAKYIIENPTGGLFEPKMSAETRERTEEYLAKCRAEKDEKRSTRFFPFILAAVVALVVFWFVFF